MNTLVSSANMLGDFPGLNPTCACVNGELSDSLPDFYVPCSSL